MATAGNRDRCVPAIGSTTLATLSPLIQCMTPFRMPISSGTHGVLHTWILAGPQSSDVPNSQAGCQPRIIAMIALQ